MIKKLILLFLLSSSVLIGQEKNYLDHILATENTLSNTEFLNTILKIEYDKALIDAKKYLLLAEKAAQIAIKINDKKSLAKAYEAKSLAYHFSSKTALSIANNLKAIKIYREINDHESLANTYINLGWKIKNSDLDKAIFYMNKGIKVLEINNLNPIDLSGAYNNYGVLKHRKEQLDSALYFHNKSLKLSIINKDSIGIPFAQTHIAQVYIKQRKFKEAEKRLEESLNIRKKRNDIYGITDSYLYLGDLYFAKKEFNSSLNYFKKAEKIANKNSYFPLKKYATEYIYKSYEQSKDFKNAFKYYKLYSQLKDSVLNKTTNSKIAELKIKFETNEKEKEITEQKLIIKNRNLYTTLLAATLIILIILSLGYYHRYQFKKKQLQKEIALKDALSKIKIQNRLQEQRLRISRDLHDNIGSQLTFIISSIDNLKYISKDINNNFKSKLTSISSFTGDTIHQLRDTIWAMNKSEISVEDLHARILSFTEKAKIAVTNTNFKVEYDIDKNGNFSSLMGMNVFRVLQEALNNAIKYAEAKNITIKLLKVDTNFTATIIDDGIGFKKDEINFGNGLSNMKKRMNTVNGSLKIDSEKKKGTKITLKVSLKNTSNDV